VQYRRVHREWRRKDRTDEMESRGTISERNKENVEREMSLENVQHSTQTAEGEIMTIATKTT
jgi:hypothetical protein